MLGRQGKQGKQSNADVCCVGVGLVVQGKGSGVGWLQTLAGGAAKRSDPEIAHVAASG